MKHTFVSILLAVSMAAGVTAIPVPAKIRGAQVQPTQTQSAHAVQAQPAQITDSTQAGGDVLGARNVDEDYKYKVLDDGTVEITGYSGTESVLTVSAKLGGRKVTSIGESAFHASSTIREVTIPQGVTAIGEGAFRQCKSLEGISIPQGVTAIGGSAFMECTSLKRVNIPDGVTAIEGYTFSYCDSLERVSLPDSITYIGESAFGACMNLKSVNIPKGVTKITGYTFYICPSLTDVTIPEGVTYIGEHAFFACESLREIKIPEGVQYIDWSAFCGCKKLTDVTLPNSLEIISEEAFEGCESLKNVTIPEGVWRIGEYAFAGCTSLKSIMLPASTKNIAKGAFHNCSSLKDVFYAGDRQARTKINLIGIENTDLMCAVIHYGDSLKSETFAPQKGDTLTDGTETYQIKTDIETVAFVKTTSTDAKITIPEYVQLDGILYNVASVTKNAFKDNKRVEKIVIQAEITSIGKNAFYGCSRLKKILIRSDSLETVGADALKGIHPKAVVKVRKARSYPKLFEGKGQGRGVKVVEYF